MAVTVARRTVCLLLALSQLGCRSVYRFQCTCAPSPAGVLVGEEMAGETPCDVEIPRDSDWIHDSKIEFTFCLLDGREKRTVVDLHGLKPSNPLAEFVAAPFFLAGGGMFVAALDDDEEEDEDAAWECDEDKDEDDQIILGAAGLGIAVIGSGLYHLLGGKSESLEAHEVHMNFMEPVSDEISK